MLRYILPIALLALPVATAEAAQSADWSEAETVTVALSNFEFAPDTIELEHGHPYRLHFVNSAGGGHNFVARDFFRAAELGLGAGETLDNGKVELDGGESADVYVMVAEPGEYEMHCSHFMHTTFGMRGRIVVH